MHVEYKIYFLRNHDAGCVIGHAIATNVPARCCRAKRQFTHFGLLEQQETKESCINPGKTIMATENGHKSIFFSGAIFSSLSLVHVLSTKCSVLFVEDRIKILYLKESGRDMMLAFFSLVQQCHDCSFSLLSLLYRCFCSAFVREWNAKDKTWCIT